MAVVKRNAVRVMMDLVADLNGVAELAARRIPQLCEAMEVPISEADSNVYRMATFAAVLDDKANIDNILDEVERLAREKVASATADA